MVKHNTNKTQVSVKSTITKQNSKGKASGRKRAGKESKKNAGKALAEKDSLPPKDEASRYTESLYDMLAKTCVKDFTAVPVKDAASIRGKTNNNAKNKASAASSSRKTPATASLSSRWVEELRARVQAIVVDKHADAARKQMDECWLGRLVCVMEKISALPTKKERTSAAVAIRRIAMWLLETATPHGAMSGSLKELERLFKHVGVAAKTITRVREQLEDAAYFDIVVFGEESDDDLMYIDWDRLPKRIRNKAKANPRILGAKRLQELTVLRENWKDVAEKKFGVTYLRRDEELLRQKQEELRALQLEDRRPLMMLEDGSARADSADKFSDDDFSDDESFSDDDLVSESE